MFLDKNRGWLLVPGGLPLSCYQNEVLNNEMKSATFLRLMKKFLVGFVLQLDETEILTIIVSETLNESLLLFPIGAKYCIACTKLAVRKCKV